MPITTPDPLSPPQRARAEAVTIAGRVVNGASFVGTGGVKTPDSTAEILTIADFILGPPSLGSSLFDLFGSSAHVHLVPLDEIFRDSNTEDGDEAEGPVDVPVESVPQEAEPTAPLFDDDDLDDPFSDDYVHGPRKVRDNPQA